MAINTATRFVPMEVDSYTAVVGDEATDKHVFTFPRVIAHAIAQVRSATGTVNSAGLDIDISSATVTVAVTTLATGDIIEVIAW